MNDLLRELAPISPEAWKEIEAEAKRTLKVTLAARRVVDFSGPLGWETSAIRLGRASVLKTPIGENVEARLRKTQPLVEFRTPFEISRTEIETVARGSKDPDLESVTQAARTAGLAEDRTVFHGYADAEIVGMFQAGTESALTISDSYETYPGLVAEATNKLRSEGVDGPYAIALGPKCYTGLTKTTANGGYPIIKHVAALLDGPIVWAPGVDGAVVLTLRGGDFELNAGEDFSIGYLEHSATTVRLYIQESFTFRVLSPEAVVPLTYTKKRG